MTDTKHRLETNADFFRRTFVHGLGAIDKFDLHHDAPPADQIAALARGT
ncbi:hypothetical protein [Burkholderia cenocepacia]|nr:hypothetical protein [Burkholderia cenocepacia]MCW3610633.1 hypothetical protein [Burkholderia cenocepacia]MCW5191707.1 hypothetical protein [Burkholderia cenocepacia]